MFFPTIKTLHENFWAADGAFSKALSFQRQPSFQMGF